MSHDNKRQDSSTKDNREYEETTSIGNAPVTQVAGVWILETFLRKAHDICFEIKSSRMIWDQFNLLSGLYRLVDVVNG